MNPKVRLLGAQKLEVRVFDVNEGWRKGVHRRIEADSNPHWARRIVQRKQDS